MTQQETITWYEFPKRKPSVKDTRHGLMVTDDEGSVWGDCYYFPGRSLGKLRVAFTSIIIPNVIAWAKLPKGWQDERMEEE